MNTIIDAVIQGIRFLFAFRDPLSKCGSVATIALAIYAAVSGLINTLIVKMDNMLSIMGSISGGTADFRPLAFVNFVFPLDDFLALVGGYMVLLGAAALVRIAKSFIPTIS